MFHLKSPFPLKFAYLFGFIITYVPCNLNIFIGLIPPGLMLLPLSFLGTNRAHQTHSFSSDQVLLG